MARPAGKAAVLVQRFFDFSLLGLVVSGYLAVAGSGYLDTPTVALTGAGLALRALMIAGLVRFEVPGRAVSIATLAYTGFFALDYLVLSRDFLTSTVHLVFFLAVIKVLTARTNRDYAFVAVIAFLELLAAALLSSNLNFFAFLALYLLFAMAGFTSSEIRRAIQRPQTVARSGLRRFHPRLAMLTCFMTVGILSLTFGLFFMLPRTASAALDRLVSKRILLPGFSNQVTLGQIGEVKSSSEPVMHVQVDRPETAANAKWRGAALGEFDGRRWYNPSNTGQVIRIEGGRLVLSTLIDRPGTHFAYGIDLNAYKRQQMERRIRSNMQRYNVSTFQQYYSLLQSNEAARDEFLDRITINVSELFRNLDQFDVLKKSVLPKLLAEKRDLNIWSAGCSCGAEAYTLSILLNELAPSGHHKILATDIDDKMLARCKAGVYQAHEMRSVSGARTAKYFDKQPDGYVAKDIIRSQIKCQKHNLLDDKFDRGFDLILCRNVVIYFTDETKTNLYTRFLGALRPGGYLFVGGTERIGNAAEIGFANDLPFFYRKPGSS
jgi:chemotaxis protein methyltransferase CheR